MKRRVVALMALVLSFLYCGLGQIYRRRIIKGINFIVIYSLLVVSYFFSELSSILRGLNLLVILLVWIMGMVDAYLDQRFLKWQRLQNIMSFSVITCAVLTLLVTHIATSLTSDKYQPAAQNTVAALGDTSAMHNNDETAASEASPEANTKTDAAENMEAIPVSLYKADFSIEDYNIKPVIAKPGTTLTVEYIINASQDKILGLGFSIQRFNTHKWVNDISNDMAVSVSAGRGKYFRNFVIPSTLRPGEYNVICGLWDSDYTTKYYSRQSDKALNIISSVAADDVTDGSDFFSIQVATFRNSENAGKMYDKLILKGYPARIEYPVSSKESFCVVMVGESYSRQSAVEVARELREREGLSGIIIRRRANEMEKYLSTRSIANDWRSRE